MCIAPERAMIQCVFFSKDCRPARGKETSRDWHDEGIYLASVDFMP
jgi:hypothetical protein